MELQQGISFCRMSKDSPPDRVPFSSPLRLSKTKNSPALFLTNHLRFESSSVLPRPCAGNQPSLQHECFCPASNFSGFVFDDVRTFSHCRSKNVPIPRRQH